MIKPLEDVIRIPKNKDTSGCVKAAEFQRVANSIVLTTLFAIVGIRSDYLPDARIEKLSYPQSIPFCGRYAYLRKE